MQTNIAFVSNYIKCKMFVGIIEIIGYLTKHLIGNEVKLCIDKN
jgi:hypothetical protein